MPTQWTTADFDDLSWHDCHIHGLRLADIHEERCTAELELDLDFIVEWLCPPTPQDAREVAAFRFRVAPATLTFHEVSDLRVELDYATPTAAMTPFSIHGIERESITHASGQTSCRWRLPLTWPDGEITFTSPGFTQALRREPIMTGSQRLTPAQRNG